MPRPRDPRRRSCRSGYAQPGPAPGHSHGGPAPGGSPAEAKRRRPCRNASCSLPLIAMHRPHGRARQTSQMQLVLVESCPSSWTLLITARLVLHLRLRQVWLVRHRTRRGQPGLCRDHCPAHAMLVGFIHCEQRVQCGQRRAQLTLPTSAGRIQLARSACLPPARRSTRSNRVGGDVRAVEQIADAARAWIGEARGAALQIGGVHARESDVCIIAPSCHWPYTLLLL